MNTTALDNNKLNTEPTEIFCEERFQNVFLHFDKLTQLSVFSYMLYI